MKTKSEFSQPLNRLLVESLSDPNLNSKFLAARMGMSRMHLHRHLKRYCGCSASEYISRKRLRTARHFLAATTLPVSEVAYRVGYRDPAYFTRVFKRQFGVTPREARRRAEG